MYRVLAIGLLVGVFMALYGLSEGHALTAAGGTFLIGVCGYLLVAESRR